MADVLRFVSPQKVGVPTQTVYWKARWADEWIAVPELWAAERTWATGPSISAASLRIRYGNRLPAGARQFARAFSQSNKLRFYVRIIDSVLAINDDDESELTRTWTGVLDIELDEQDGPDIERDGDDTFAYPRGKNHFLAYGLESILSQSTIDQSVVVDEDGLFKTVPVALAFNSGLANTSPSPFESGEGNRSLEPANFGAYAFHGARTGGQKWTTKTAVEYLLANCTARDWNDEVLVRFYLADEDGVLPDWDQPILPTEGLSVLEALNALISRQRGLGWYVSVLDGGGETPDAALIVPYTFSDELLELTEDAELPPNPSQKILAVEQDRGSDLVLKRTSVDQVDQVIARGERRTSTATFSFADGTLDIGWPSDLEEAYEKGASEADDYPAAGEVADRNLRDEECRKADKFKPVYTRFVLPDPYNGRVGDGLGSIQTDFVPLMPVDEPEDPEEPEVTYVGPDDRRFLTQLALLEGLKYDGDAIDGGNPEEDAQKPHKHLKPFVLFPLPNDDQPGPPEGEEQIDPAERRYRHAEKIGLSAALEGSANDGATFTMHVHVDHFDGALWVEPSDEIQHFTARTDFSPLPDDVWDEELALDFREMLATLSVRWSEFAEARFPAQEDLPFGNDVLRRLIIEVPNRRLDYVAPQTVVALDETTGKLLRTDAGGFVRDDRDELQLAAQLAFQWYGAPRRALNFSTSLVNNALELGDLIVSVGDPDLLGDGHTEDVRSVVTLIRIVSPLAEGTGAVAPAAPRIVYETSYAELDVVKLMPRHSQK